jgi:hypothetical protein
MPVPDQTLSALMARLSGTYSLLIKLKLAKNSAINMASIGVAHLS